MKAKPTIELDKEKMDAAIANLRTYVQENLDMEIGTLAARLMINDLMTYLGVECYNLGVMDAQKWIGAYVDEMYELLK